MTPSQDTNKRDVRAALALMGAGDAGHAHREFAAWPRIYQAPLLRRTRPSASRRSHSTKSVLHWVNDGLMAIFFLLVGIEIKREYLAGELSSPRRAVLPAIAAIGGMLAPALVYAWCNRGQRRAARRVAYSHGHRHRVCAVGVLRIAGNAGAAVTANFSAGARGHRRPRRASC